MRVDTPLLVVGTGPATLVVAKVAAGYGLPCLLVGHEPTEVGEPVALTADAVTALRRHGLFDVLRPYFDAIDPPTITPRVFEDVVKHHCVADFNVTVYDRMVVNERRSVGDGVCGVLTDGKHRWELSADRFVDGGLLPRTLSAAITAGAITALEAVDAARATAAASRPPAEPPN